MGNCLPHTTIPTHTALWGAGNLWEMEDTTTPLGLVVWEDKITVFPPRKVEAGGMGCFFLSIKAALHFYTGFIY